MTILRIIKDKNNPYVIINKEVIQNPELSLKARGLLAFMLSFPDNWAFNRADLIKRLNKDGKTSVDSCLAELEELGHLFREQPKASDGRFMPGIINVIEVPGSDFQTRTGSDFLATDNGSLISTNVLSTNVTKKRDINISTKRVLDSNFENFWNSYPRKLNKQKAYSLYLQALKKISYQKLMEGLERYVKHIQDDKTETKFIAHPTTWLSQERWENEYNKVLSERELSVRRTLQKMEEEKIEAERVMKLSPDEFVAYITKKSLEEAE